MRGWQFLSPAGSGKPQAPRPRGGRSTAGWMFRGSFLPPLRPELINHFYTAWKAATRNASLMQKTPSGNYLPADISVRDVQQLKCFREQVTRTSWFPCGFTPVLLSSSSCTPEHDTRVHCLVCVCSSQAFVTPICTAACVLLPTSCRVKGVQFPKTSPGGTQHPAIADPARSGPA